MKLAGKRAGERRRARGALAQWALVLAALLLAPFAQASLPRPAATDGAALRVASLAAPDDVERFALFAGDELAYELACDSGAASAITLAPGDAGDLALAPLALASRVREDRFSLHLGADVFGLEPLRGPAPLSEDLCQGDDECSAGTRIGGLELQGPFFTEGQSRLSLELQWACSVSSFGLADGKPLDPWGLYSPAGVGQKIRSFLAPLRKRAEAAWNALPPVAQVGWTLLSQQNPALFPTPQSAVANVENTLAKPFEIGDKTGTLYGEGASGWEIAASVGDDVSTTITTGMTVATLGSSAAVAGAKAVAPAAGARLESALSAPLGGQGQRLYQYTDDAGGAGLRQPPNRINPSDPETMFSVNAEGQFDAGWIGRIDRSETPNVFLTDVPPSQIGAHAERLLPRGRTYTHSVELTPAQIESQGFRLFPNPQEPNIFNVPCPNGVGPCAMPGAVKPLPKPVAVAP